MEDEGRTDAPAHDLEAGEPAASQLPPAEETSTARLGPVADAEGAQDPSAVAKEAAPSRRAWRRRAKKAEHPSYPVVFDEHGIPKRIKWRPIFSFSPIMWGILIDVAIEVILQQAGYLILDAQALAIGVTIGAIVGGVAPSVGSFVGVTWANYRIRVARREGSPA